MFLRNTESNTNKKETRNVVKAFLITGGSEFDREHKCEQLADTCLYPMWGSYKSANEIAVIFSYDSDDFKGMTFEEAKKLAGNETLESIYCEAVKSSHQPCFGVIEVNDLRQRLNF